MWGSGGSNYAYGFYGEQRELENHGVSSNVNWNRYYNRQEIRKGYGTQFHASSVLRPRVERVGLARIVPEELNMKSSGRTDIRNGSLEGENVKFASVWHKNNLRYVGITFWKRFGHLGFFKGTVQYVHWIVEVGFLARVFYEEDGDIEDLHIAELESLLQANGMRKAVCDHFYFEGDVPRLICEKNVTVEVVEEPSCCVSMMNVEVSTIGSQPVDLSFTNQLLFQNQQRVKPAQVPRKSDTISHCTVSIMVRKELIRPPSLSSCERSMSNPKVAPTMVTHKFSMDLSGAILNLPGFSTLHLSFAAGLVMISRLAFQSLVHSLEWWLFRGWDPPW